MAEYSTPQTELRDKLDAKSGSFQYVWPSELGSSGEEPYTQFEVYTSVNAHGGVPSLLGIIALPIPMQLQDELHIDYTQHNFAIDKISAFNKMWQKNSDAIKADLVPLGMLGAAKLRSDKIDAAWVEQKIQRIMNPHESHLFSGMKMRQFNFSWTMMAKNMQESEQIKRILIAFKYHSLPDAPEAGDTSRWWYYPENFKVKLICGGGGIGTQGKEIFKTALCAITTIKTSYNGSAVPAFFEDTGEPVQITMNLSFTEHGFMTKQRVIEGY